MINTQVSNQTNLLQYNNDIAKKQAQITALNQDKQLQRYFLTGAFILVGIIALTVVVLLRNNRQKQKANNLLSKQKYIIEEQRDQTNKALADLQLTQKQLIQSEKMASLGELTAGIAHEIQNPLNFVNNFSEVNIELIDEMELELSKGDKDEAMSIAGDIKQNLEKIRHHGKRADGIVKGMLQHSRASSDTLEPTDLNVLADEYLRLAYHGLRAKDKSFNADLNTNFADKLPMVNIVPQDIGRALLNLFNNAFYAVSQKQKTAGADYKPEVSVSTSAENEQVIIKVKDKGNGIPDAIKDKIMQPFFTTKPTGEGTGLGLSLTYDIIVKVHGGSIQVNSVEGEGSEFIIQLPIN
jgi:signal transduction histidine kinase